MFASEPTIPMPRSALLSDQMALRWFAVQADDKGFDRGAPRQKQSTLVAYLLGRGFRPTA